MKTSTAIKYLGSKYAIARHFGISRQAVSQWGAVVPFEHAETLEEDSGGAVKVDKRLYRFTGKKK